MNLLIQDMGFVDLQPDFYRFMTTFGKMTPKAGKDYITRLKFLSKNHKIDFTLTPERIESILAQEERDRTMRDKYTSKKSISDFRSGLNKFLAFINFDYEKISEHKLQTEIDNVTKSANLSATEKEAVIQARIGQGVFRRSLVKHWNGCSISGCGMKDMLIASHIKPWRDSTNTERLDYFNGLLLLPNYDKLFDRGYITINSSGMIILSKFLSINNRLYFGLDRFSAIKIETQHKPYLEYHNYFCFMG